MLFEGSQRRWKYVALCHMFAEQVPSKFRNAVKLNAFWAVSITSGMFPDILKQAEICPIFKKGDAMNVCNYRPVSILPIVSKIYEKEMVRQLENYFEDILSLYISDLERHIVAKQF